MNAIMFYSTVLWLGPTLHLGLAVVPQLARSVDDRALRAGLIVGIMRRYNPASWTSLTLLLVSTLTVSLTRFQSGQIQLSLGPMILVSLLFILDFLHSFIFGPRGFSSEASRRTAVNIAKVETILALPLPALLLMLALG